MWIDKSKKHAKCNAYTFMTNSPCFCPCIATSCPGDATNCRARLDEIVKQAHIYSWHEPCSILLSKGAMGDFSNNFRRPSFSLTTWAIVVFVIVACSSGVGLWCLKSMHHKTARVMATRTVLEQGQQISDFLAKSCPPCASNLSPEQWRTFNALVDSLHAAQNNLQFVSVARNGITIIHRQTTTLLSAPGQEDTTHCPSHTSDETSVFPQNIELGGTSIPVMVFHRVIELADTNDGPIQIDVGFLRGAVDKEQHAASSSIESLFRLSVLTLILAFGACLLLLIGVVRRDRIWSERHRQEEHLAFSGVLANGIVHDFRNPMSSVRLDAQMLDREARRPEGPRLERLSDLAGRIGRTVERMDRTFQEFLYLAKPTDESFESVDLAECVRESLETLASRFEHAGVSSAIIWKNPPPAVRASPFALRRALMNVLLNAVQFSPARTSVELDARAANDLVELDIMDRGPGIPAKERKRIFEMFVTTRPGGTGLGLFLARTAVRKCGGEIFALERPGGGTIIRIQLPCVKSTDTASVAPSTGDSP